MSLAPKPALALGTAAIPHPARVLQLHQELPGTVTMRLEASPAAGGGAFAPGQFNMLYVFGVGEVPISCSGNPDELDGHVHTVRAVGTSTRALVATQLGGTVGVRGPFGSAWPLDEARGQDVLLIAGGLGVATLRPALCHILGRRADYGRVVMLYGARSPGDFLYEADREAWGAREDLELGLTVDHASPGWAGPVGVVPALLAGLALDAGRTVALLCGPEGMMRATVRELERLGLGARRIWVSLERNMKCATGVCGHCLFGPVFVCKDGPVFRFDRVAGLFHVREA